MNQPIHKLVYQPGVLVNYLLKYQSKELTITFIRQYDIKASVVEYELLQMVGNFFGRFLFKWTELWIFAEGVYHCHHTCGSI